MCSGHAVHIHNALKQELPALASGLRAVATRGPLGPHVSQGDYVTAMHRHSPALFNLLDILGLDDVYKRTVANIFVQAATGGAATRPFPSVHIAVGLTHSPQHPASAPCFRGGQTRPWTPLSAHWRWTSRAPASGA